MTKVIYRVDEDGEVYRTELYEDGSERHYWWSRSRSWEHKSPSFVEQYVFARTVLKTRIERKAMMRAAAIAAERLQNFVPHDVPGAFRKSDYYEKGAEKYPFFTEGYLYPLLGKEDARTLRAYMRHLLSLVGVEL